MEKHNGELEIEEDIGFERKTWRWQRIGWVIMLLVVLAALLGFTGRGGLLNVHKQTASSPAMEVEYERFQRREAESELKITIHQASAPATSLHFSKEFYTKQRIDRVVPEPDQVKTTEDGITYTFAHGGSSGQVIFYTYATDFGSINYTVHGADNSEVSVQHFVYP